VGAVGSRRRVPLGWGRVSVSAVCEYFGVASGSLSDRANTLRKAAGIFEDEYHQSSWSIRLGDAALLHSQRRVAIIAQRDARPSDPEIG